MNQDETDNVFIETPKQRPLDDQHNDLKDDRVGAEKRPSRPLGERSEKTGVKQEPACVCSNCGHVIAKAESVACPLCPACNGRMEAV